jgi:hypothetical protein
MESDDVRNLQALIKRRKANSYDELFSGYKILNLTEASQFRSSRAAATCNIFHDRST